MYSSSVTTGNWEEFVAKELVSYVDNHYRTIPDRASRGLAGHSMGGYGTLRIAMKQFGIFSSIYALNPCCLLPNMDFAKGEARMAKAEAVRDVAEIEKADFGTKAALASGAAWSPNPKNPPLFLDLPWRDGEFRPLILAKWAANAPLAMVDQYLPGLKQLRAIAFDAGTKEAGISAGVKALDQILTDNGVEHTSEIYEGDHTNRVAERIETTVLPFFSKNLSFGGR
jgi:enterochelin esterase-like enzyme